MFYFTPLPGFFSPFPHGTYHYRSPSSIQPYGVVPTCSYKISRVSYYSGYYLSYLTSITGLSPSMICFPKQFLFVKQIDFVVLYPIYASIYGLGSSAFARHYLQNRVFFLFLQVLRCFSSLRSLPLHYFTCVWIDWFFSQSEFPHSDIYGSNGYLLLTIAFRSLSRPSSALGAQVSSLCPLQLNLLYFFFFAYLLFFSLILFSFLSV